MSSPEQPEGRKRQLEAGIESIEKHVIDCDADPFIPSGALSVEEHQKGGQFTWDAAQVQLYRSEAQQQGKMVYRDKLRAELKGKSVLNANVLDYLIAHPALIPDEWKSEAVVFWGTTYRLSTGGLFVRYLCWRDGAWGWSRRWVGYGLDGHFPAALRSS